MITGLAHSGVCVPDCEAAVAYYRDVLGFTVLSPPYVMDGDAIRADMGELLDDPAMKAAIVGFGDDGDRVLEVIEYLRADGSDAQRSAGLADRTEFIAVYDGERRNIGPFDCQFVPVTHSVPHGFESCASSWPNRL